MKNVRWETSADQKIWEKVQKGHVMVGQEAFGIGLSGALDHLKPSQDGKRHLFVREIVSEGYGLPEYQGDSFILTLEKGV